MGDVLKQIIQTSEYLSDKAKEEFLSLLNTLSEKQKSKILELLVESPEYTGLLYKNFLRKEEYKSDIKQWETIVDEEISVLMNDEAGSKYR